MNCPFFEGSLPARCGLSISVHFRRKGLKVTINQRNEEAVELRERCHPVVFDTWGVCNLFFCIGIMKGHGAAWLVPTIGHTFSEHLEDELVGCKTIPWNSAVLLLLQFHPSSQHWPKKTTNLHQIWLRVNYILDFFSKPHLSPRTHKSVRRFFLLWDFFKLGVALRARDLQYMDVSKNSATPKSFILIGFSILKTIHFGVPLMKHFDSLLEYL